MNRYDRHYHPRHRHGHIHFMLDIGMVTTIVLLLSGVIGYLRVSRPLRLQVPPPHASVVPATELNATATLRLATREGDPLWAGPLPLVVGRETRLRVFFDVVGLKSTQQNMVLTAVAVAPVGISATMTANQGSLTSAQGRIHWDIAGRVNDSGSAQASVEIRITPSNADVGKTLPVLTDIVLTGQDTATKTPIDQRMPPVDTAALPNALGVVTK